MTETPAQGHSGESDQQPADRLQPDADHPDRKQRQDELLDESVEESFPASDPISPKRIT